MEVAGHRGSCGEDCFRGAVTPLLEGCSQPKATLLGGGQEKKHPTRSKLSIQKSNIMAYGPITSQQIDGGKVEIVTDFIFLGSKITVDGDCRHEIKKTLVPWKKSYDKPRQHIQKQRYRFADKGPYSQSYSFSTSHVWV